MTEGEPADMPNNDNHDQHDALRHEFFVACGMGR
jgi:hypothetical protein